MKVLVISLSQQHIPNLLSVEAVKPDIVAYVETNEMRKKDAWNNLKAALDLHDIEFDARKYALENENSFDSIKELFWGIQEEYANDELIVNLTGGTKLMSIGAYEVFRESDTKMIYKPFRYINRFVVLGENRTLEFQSNLSVRQFLRGYGYDITSSDEKIEKSAKSNAGYFEVAAHLTANHDNPTISKCLSNLKRIYNEAGGSGNLVVGKSDGLFTSDQHLKSFLVGNLGMDSGSDHYLHGTLNKHHVKFLSGEWLEVFLWGLLDRWSSSLGVFDPVQSVNIQKRTVNGIVENEFDVVFLHNNALFVIECKTGRQEYDRNGKNTLYKLKSVTNQLNALKTKTFLATTSWNILDNSGAVKESFASRAKEYSCRIIAGNDIRRLALAHISKENEKVKNDLNKMFDL